MLSNPNKALIIIPCSATKVLKPLINYNQSAIALNGVGLLRQNLLNALLQDRAFISNPTNQSGVLSANSSKTIACELYNGKMYSKIKGMTRLIAQNQHPDIHILILSALYGIVQLNEELQLYDLTMGTSIANQAKSDNKVYKAWKKSNLSDIVFQYITNQEINNVWSLLPDSMPKFPYHRVLTSLWKRLCQNNISCYHIFPGKEKNQCAGLYRGLWLNWMLHEYISNNANYILNNPKPSAILSGIGTTYEYRNCN